MLNGVYRNSTAVFHEVAAPTLEELQALLAKVCGLDRARLALQCMIARPGGSDYRVRIC